MTPPMTRTRRAALLLEMLIALAVFLTTGLAILAAVHQGQRTLNRSAERARAVDLARSAAAEIRAGIATAEDLDGPVEREALVPLAADIPAEPTGWTLDIETDRAGDRGLTILTVTATHDDDPARTHISRALITPDNDNATARTPNPTAGP